MKILFIVLDGLGDRPVAQLDKQTPLEAAKTPNLDLLAQRGLCGLMTPAYTSIIPTSEEGHFSLFSYDPRIYRIRRGIFTAMGSGIKLQKGDVALRGNFGTIDEKMNMIDRRAGRISNIKPLIKALDGTIIDGVKIIIKHAGGHRIGVVLRGKGLSDNISDGDPHYSALGKKAKKIKALDNKKTSIFTAEVLNKFLQHARPILKNHPLNEERIKKGLPSANYILFRGASSFREIPSFKEKYGLEAACVAGKILYQQIGKILGMHLVMVKGANGLATTNLEGKIRAVKRALKKYGFVFLHIKATDSLAEDGNWEGKKKFIEKIDEKLKPLLDTKNALIIVTADHSTCCDLKRHCVEPVPVLIYGDGVRADKVQSFSEKACKKGALGKFRGLKLMPMILKLSRLNKGY